MVIEPWCAYKRCGITKCNILNHTLSFTINMNAQNLIYTNMDPSLFQDLQH